MEYLKIEQVLILNELNKKIVGVLQNTQKNYFESRNIEYKNLFDAVNIISYETRLTSNKNVFYFEGYYYVLFDSNQLCYEFRIVENVDGCFVIENLKDEKFNIIENVLMNLNIEFNSEILDFVKTNNLDFYLTSLNNSKTFKCGYRTNCGKNKINKTEYLNVEKLRKIMFKNNIVLLKSNLKVDNSYATLSGGFWEEFLYEIVL